MRAYDVSKYEYDNNGNITKLWRNNQTGLDMDYLDYYYNNGTNRLNYVHDDVGSIGMRNQSSGNYSYDSNGNMVSDADNDISYIFYNADNLPAKIIKTDGNQQRYYYNDKNARTGGGNGDNSFIPGVDGKIEATNFSYTGGNYTYNIWGHDNIGQVRDNNGYRTKYYYLKDHLGTIKMTVNGNGGVISYNDYYPYGSLMPGRSLISSADDRYKFTGKERDSETNYDYFGARYYDSRIGRWLQVDPLADKYPGVSPYVYAMNNPIKYVDPDGKNPWVALGGAIGGAEVATGILVLAGGVLTAVGLENTGKAVNSAADWVHNNVKDL